ncbi:hypothetical protein SLS58_011156 [Diplodia intermedia]|uniref:PD-(D/E)XK nuclease-like domain-containing protein n=1 Tax=Diplodia intermedia TaxID=856260 RepID=A0ABR3T140_9PEZI
MRGGKPVEGKTVDFAVFLRPSSRAASSAIRSRLQRAVGPGGAAASINNTLFDPLRERPVAIGITTRMPSPSSRSEEDVRVRLAVWAGAQFARLRSLCPTAARLVDLPLVYVCGESWYPFIASSDSLGAISRDASDRLLQTLHGIYKVANSLRRLARWVETDFQAWFERHVLPV